MRKAPRKMLSYQNPRNVSYYKTKLKGKIPLELTYLISPPRVVKMFQRLKKGNYIN